MAGIDYTHVKVSSKSIVSPKDAWIESQWNRDFYAYALKIGDIVVKGKSRAEFLSDYRKVKWGVKDFSKSRFFDDTNV